MGQIILGLGFGIVSASVIALGAVGFTLQFGISRIFNVSYGVMMTTSAYVAYMVDVAWHTNLWAGMVAGALTGCVLALATERLLFSPFLRRGAAAFTLIMVALALDTFMQNAIVAVAGPNFFDYRLLPTHVYRVLGTDWTLLEFTLVIIAVVAMIGVHVILRRTRLGTAMRATAADASLAGGCGINSRRTTSLTWALSGLLCGLAGVVLAVSTAAFSSTTGSDFVLIVFAAAVVGGLGQPYGAMLGALTIGIITEEVAIYNPNYKYVAAFLVLIVMLQVRPGGLLQLGGRARREGAAA